MDLGRYFRALEAKSMLPIERKRTAWLGGVLKSEDLARDEWAVIEEHDRLVSDG
jgi:hypothetical protein